MMCFAGKNLKPYQGLKPSGCVRHDERNDRAGKNLKPYQGLKLLLTTVHLRYNRRKKPKTLSGIETLIAGYLMLLLYLPEKT